MRVLQKHQTNEPAAVRAARFCALPRLRNPARADRLLNICGLSPALISFQSGRVHRHEQGAARHAAPQAAIHLGCGLGFLVGLVHFAGQRKDKTGRVPE